LLRAIHRAEGCGRSRYLPLRRRHRRCKRPGCGDGRRPRRPRQQVLKAARAPLRALSLSEATLTVTGQTTNASDHRSPPWRPRTPRCQPRTPVEPHKCVPNEGRVEFNPRRTRHTAVRHEPLRRKRCRGIRHHPRPPSGGSPPRPDRSYGYDTGKVHEDNHRKERIDHDDATKPPFRKGRKRWRHKTGRPR